MFLRFSVKFTIYNKNYFLLLLIKLWKQNQFWHVTAYFFTKLLLPHQKSILRSSNAHHISNLHLCNPIFLLRPYFSQKLISLEHQGKNKKGNIEIRFCQAIEAIQSAFQSSFDLISLSTQFSLQIIKIGCQMRNIFSCEIAMHLPNYSTQFLSYQIFNSFQ